MRERVALIDKAARPLSTTDVVPDIPTLDVNLVGAVAAGSATSANQTNGSQKTQIVDQFGNVITSSSGGGVLVAKRPIDTGIISLSTDRYIAFISVRQSALTAAGSVVWAMRNAALATKDAYIDNIEIQMSFDTATPAARSTQRYSIIRFSGATPTGGSVITPTKLDNANSAPQVSDIRTASGGLTIVGVVQAETLSIPGVPAVDGSVMLHALKNLGLRLAPGEGILISLLTTAVIGQYIGGNVVWSER